MRLLSLDEVIQLHTDLVEQSGGSTGIRDFGGLESALRQPTASFGGRDLYPTIVEKAAALGHSLVANHPFVDGNKRIGHAAMEAFLFLNGYELEATVDDGEAVILSVAAGTTDRAAFTEWVRNHVRERKGPSE